MPVRFVVRSCVAAALAAPLLAQPSAPSLDALAAGWSGGRASARCEPSPSRDPVVVAMGTEVCHWPRTTRGRGSARVEGTRYREGGLTQITWDLQVADRTTALRLRDSLSTALRRRGLAEYPCRGDGRRWQRDGLAVDFLVGAVFPDGLLRVAVMATTLTEAAPAFLCPDAPVIPSRRPSEGPRRAAAT